MRAGTAPPLALRKLVLPTGRTPAATPPIWLPPARGQCVRAHMWAPMTRETSSESPGSTHQSSCQRPPYPRVRGCAPRRNRLGRHLGGALRQRGLGRRLGGVLRQRHLGWRLSSARTLDTPSVLATVGVLALATMGVLACGVGPCSAGKKPHHRLEWPSGGKVPCFLAGGGAVCGVWPRSPG